MCDDLYSGLSRVVVVVMCIGLVDTIMIFLCSFCRLVLYIVELVIVVDVVVVLLFDIGVILRLPGDSNHCGSC